MSLKRANRRLLALLAACVMLPSVLVRHLRGEDWPRWRGPRLDGISQELLDLASLRSDRPRTLWRAEVGTGFSSVVVSAGRAYTAGNHDDADQIFCLDAETGNVVWRHAYPAERWPYLYAGGTNCTPTVDAERIYFLGRHGELLCLEAGNGAVRWRRQLRDELGFALPDWGFTSPPWIRGDVVFVNAGSHGAAFDKNSGAEMWTTGHEKAGYAMTVPVEGGEPQTLLVFSPTELAALSLAGGRVRWTYPWPTNFRVNAADPIVRGNEVFVSSAYNHGCALLRMGEDGVEELWRSKTMRNHFATCLLMDGHLYGIDGTDGRNTWLKCVRWDTGETKWSELRGLGTGGLAAARNVLIVLTEMGDLVLVQADPAQYRELARWTVDELRQGSVIVPDPKCWTPPTLANSRLYCRNSAGVVVCLEVPTK